jgi:hypothetical protein
MVGRISDPPPAIGERQLDAALRRLERLPLWPWEREVLGDQLVAEEIERLQSALEPRPASEPIPLTARRDEFERR